MRFASPSRRLHLCPKSGAVMTRIDCPRGTVTVDACLSDGLYQTFVNPSTSSFSASTSRFREPLCNLHVRGFPLCLLCSRLAEGDQRNRHSLHRSTFRRLHRRRMGAAASSVMSSPSVTTTKTILSTGAPVRNVLVFSGDSATNLPHGTGNS